MKTKIIKLKEVLSKAKIQALIDSGEKTCRSNEYRKIVAEAGEILQAGGVVAFPTETVYGLGADALDACAAKKIYEAKGRPSDNPLIIHVARRDAAPKIAKDISEKAHTLMKEFWPGALTLILHKRDNVPLGTTGGLDTVAVRMPQHKMARDIIRAGGGYIAAPSANLSGRPSPTLGEHVIEDMDSRIDGIIVLDNVKVGVESTIVDCTVDPPMILRPGLITKQMLEEVVGKVDLDQTLLTSDTKLAPKAPGMKYRHYAPKGEMMIVEGSPKKICNYISKKHSKDEKCNVAVLATEENMTGYLYGTKCSCSIICIGSNTDVTEVSRSLYKHLRDMDTQGVDYIYCEKLPETPEWMAVNNRLNKAAGYKVLKL